MAGVTNDQLLNEIKECRTDIKNNLDTTHKLISGCHTRINKNIQDIHNVDTKATVTKTKLAGYMVTVAVLVSAVIRMISNYFKGG